LNKNALQQWLIKHWGFGAVWEVSAKAITAKSLIWLKKES
jgi:hypothetical protein